MFVQIRKSDKTLHIAQAGGGAGIDHRRESSMKQIAAQSPVARICRGTLETVIMYTTLALVLSKISFD